MTEQHTETLISEQDQRRIRQAMTAMPFAASTRVPSPQHFPATGRRDPITADSIVAFLLGLAEVLHEHATEAETGRQLLHSLEADVTAVRRLIGTAPVEVSR